MTKIDPRELRNAFGSFLTGVTIVTALDADGTPVGFTANSFSSVSLDPPLLLVCPALSLSSFPIFETCKTFCVNILAEGQEDLSNTFAGFSGDRFAEVSWSPDEAGNPIFDGVAAAFSCSTVSVTPAGDHAVLLGGVDSFKHSGTRGLGYAAGQYFSLGLEHKAASAPEAGRRSVAGAIVVHDGAVLLEETEEGLRPPQTVLQDRAQVRDVLSQRFKDIGYQVTLGTAYSIFDDTKSGTSYAYFRATAQNADMGELGTFVPLDALGEQKYISSAHREMLLRFALEHETQSFGLYVGDEHGGDVHGVADLEIERWGAS